MRDLLVIDVQRGHDAVGDDAGAKPTRRAADHLAVEHETHLAGPADIEVLADHLLEEDAPGHRLIENLGERELGLQDGELRSDSRRRDHAAETDAAAACSHLRSKRSIRSAERPSLAAASAWDRRRI